MRESPLRSDGLISRILGIAGCFVIVAGLKLGKELFVTFAIAALLGVVLSPLVNLLKRAHLPKVLAVFVVVILAFGLLGGVGYVLVGQGTSIAQKLPEYRENLRGRLASLSTPFSKGMKAVEDAVKELQGESKTATPARPAPGKDVPAKVELVESSPTLLTVMSTALVPFMGVLGSAAVVLLLLLFFLIYSDDIHDRVIHLAGSGRGTVASQAISDSMNGVVRYLALQAVVNISHGIVLTIGLWLLAVPNALLWGFIGGLLRFIPYLGPAFGCLLPVAFTVAVSHGWSHPLWVAAFVIGLEALNGNVVEPLVYGNRTGLSPAAIVVSAVIWAWLWDATGLLLSIPLTVCLLAIGKHIPQLQFLEVLLGGGPVSEPNTQVYLRLLSHHQMEAAEMFEKESQGKSLVEIDDTLLLPLLRMVETDRRAGEIEEEKALDLIDQIRDFAKDAGETAAGRPAAPGAAPEISILCLPASDGTDELAGSMLAEILTADHYRARSLPTDILAGEKLEVIDQEKADIVVISALPPSNLLKARYLYKRLRTRFPELPILVGVWGTSNPAALEERIAPDHKATVLGSFATAQVMLREMAEGVRLHKQNGHGPAGLREQ